MFTAGLAADIVFYSFSEWVIYATNEYVLSLGKMEDYVPLYPLFHWSFIPWSFYLVLASAFGFMLHVRKVKYQKYSEACRGLLSSYTDGLMGRLIDLLAVFALLAGTATTFSVATPLMTSILNELFIFNLDERFITIGIIFLTFVIYTYALLRGIKGISKLANLCICLFFSLSLFVLFLGGQTREILEIGFSTLGKLPGKFLEFATYTDPFRRSHFPHDFTIYYWAYWIVWCVAAPFFIGKISHGRTIRELIFGGYFFGTGATILSFIVLGNYSFSLQLLGKIDFISMYLADENLYHFIINIIKTLPYPKIFMIGILVTMILFYATSFDAIALVASRYSYKKLEVEENPHRVIEFSWCFLLIMLPIALIFSESSMQNLQTVSIVSAFPLASVIVIIVLSFLKDARTYLAEKKQ